MRSTCPGTGICTARNVADAQPDALLLSRFAGLRGDASPIGVAHIALAEAARRTNAERVSREFFFLFAGLGEGGTGCVAISR